MRYVRLLLVALILAGLSLPVMPEKGISAQSLITPEATSESLISSSALGEDYYNTQGFTSDALWSFNGKQYTTFIADNYSVMVGQRTLPNGIWQVVDTGKTVGTTDLHYTSNLGVDPNGFIHVMFGLHDQAFNGHYIVSSSAENITAWTNKTQMAGINENMVTYPSFFTNGTNLYVWYRNDTSIYLNKYNHLTTNWQAISTVIGGTATRRAYPDGISIAPNGDFQMSWVWRQVGAPFGNERVAYAVSHDFGVTWKKTDNSAYTLPIAYDSEEIVDNVTLTQGMLNTNGITSDSDSHPHITYYKSDSSGYLNYFHAWHNGTDWQINQVSTFEFMNFPSAYPGSVPTSTVHPLVRPKIVMDINDTAIILFTHPSSGIMVAAVSGNYSSWQYHRIGTGNWLYTEAQWDKQLWSSEGELNLLLSAPTGVVGSTANISVVSATPASWVNNYTQSTFFNWWDERYTQRIQLSFNGTALSANVSNQPVKIHLDSSNFDPDLVNPDLSDFRFIDKDSLTVLNTENASWDAVAGDAVFWVSANISNASPNYSDYITAYFANSSATANWNRPSVWSNAGVKAVWHFGSTANNGTSISDSSGNDYSLNVTGTTWGLSGRTLNGATDYFYSNYANWRSTDFGGHVRAWYTTSANQLQTLFASADTADVTNYIEYRQTADGKLVLVQDNGTGTSDAVTGDGIYNNGIEHQATFSSNGSAWAITVDNTTQSLTVTNNNNGDWFGDTSLRDNLSAGVIKRTTFVRYFTGTLDEIMVSNNASFNHAENEAYYLSMIDSLVGYGSQEGLNPSVVTLLPTNISINKDGTANFTLSGNLTSLGGAPSVDWWIDWGADTNYGNTTSNTTTAVIEVKSVTVVTTNVTPGGVVHFRISATNPNGTSYGADQSFTLTMPSVVTGGITNLIYDTMTNSAVLNANVPDVGVASDFYIFFEYVDLDGVTHTTTEQVGNAIGSFTQSIQDFGWDGTLQARARVRVGPVYSNGDWVTLAIPTKAGHYTGVTPILRVIPMILVLALVGGSLWFGAKGVAHMRVGNTDVAADQWVIAIVFLGAAIILFTVTFAGIDAILR